MEVAFRLTTGRRDALQRSRRMAAACRDLVVLLPARGAVACAMSMSDELRERTTAVPSQRPARTDRAATAELRVVMPPALAATIPLSADRLVVGRQAEQPGAPEIGDVSVSRKHLAIEWDAAGGFHTGVDLGSSNGSFVDSVRAVSRLPLADGSVVRLGPTV